VNQREKELYLREYSLLKSQGKPFFPYAVTKDALMACIVLLAIITMSIVFGAELGPKADPTTTTYVPRPEWYFFFLFEVLRVIKPAVLTPVATIAGILTIFAMGYLTYLGAAAGSPNSIEYPVAAKYEAGKLIVAQSGCLACHKIGENGNGGPGPNLTDIADKLPKAAILRTLENPTAPMPSFAGMPEEKKTAMVDFLSQLHGE